MEAQTRDTELIARDDLGLENVYTAPETIVEEKLTAFWREIFGIDGIGIDDDFFDLGGDSVKATRLTETIKQELGKSFMAGQIVKNPTIREIAAALEAAGRTQLPSHVFALQTGGTKAPLFLVHGAAGFFFPHVDYMRAFHDDQPVYAFQVPGYDGQMQPFDTVAEIADCYLEAILQVSPDGPWHLAGMCSGSWIVFEIARRLEESGKRPERIILIDPFIEDGRMRDEYERARRDHSGSLTAQIAYANTRFKSFTRSIRQKFTCWRATGHWIDPIDEKALAIPAIREWLLKERHDFVSADDIDATKSHEAFEGETLINAYRSDEATLASEKLRRAFYAYSSDNSIASHVDIIASEFLDRRLKNPINPLRRMMPDQTVLVQGATHMDTVSTTTSDNSEIIQRLLDEPIPGR
ncbi:alpha/beta fold hydrolase [Hoeflea sp. WL0058]|uniref:Alpha/beta fold hydrolase n=1 Tax=Flavimaribacter sediminis TaxID=2865987 RepID=A0AAE3D1V4_9HYPH|nr:alpha/beta fold hydrolase [Flavimaribacter sediminis]MBW8640040.1 alpha/beta fold hydrolase [Flavimaribacter sediminis]